MGNKEKVYIGTKVVRAMPMTLVDFMNEKGEKPLPGRVNSDGYRVVYEDGYVSWSPKATFERSYREMTQSEKNMI